MARLARALGEPTRIRMLTLLMDGRALTAKELAYGSGVEPATATAHLRRLAADALVAVRPQGRHKYFRLATPAVARCIEAMLVVARPRTSPTDEPPLAHEAARFCYDHLAGQLGIALAAGLVGRCWLEVERGAFAPTARGRAGFREFGIDLDALARGRRLLAPACLDWSERRDHVGGALGAALAGRLLELRWIRRPPTPRAVAVTPRGKDGLRASFGIDLPA